MFLSKYSNETKKNLAIAYPVMLGQLGHVLVSFADNIMVGRLGAAPLAAVSLANAVTFIALSLGIGFTFALTPLIAEADGEKNVAKGRAYFHHSMILSILLGVLLFVGLVMLEPILERMDQPQEVVELAIPYYRIIAFSMIPLLIFQSFKQLADGLAFTKYAMQAILISNVINIVLNYFLIYGISFFPRLEVIGAAYGTLISRVFLVVFIYWIISSKAGIKQYLSEFSIKKLNWDGFNKIFQIGYPTALQLFFEVSIFTAAVIMAGVLGTNAQAANQIALNLASMTFMIAVGLGVTATVRVGNQKGLKNYTELRRIALSLFLLMIAIDIVFALGFILFRNLLPLVYIDNFEVVSTASTLIVIAGFFQLSDGLQAVILGALRGLQDVKVPMLITFIAYWVIGFPVCYYLGLHTPLKTVGIWIGLLLSLTVSAFLLYLRFNRLSEKLIVLNKE